MKGLSFIFTGFFGLILTLLFMSVILMWFCAPVLLYLIYQKLSSIEEKLKK